MEKNIYPKNVDIKSEHFNIAFATNDIKKSLCQLEICIFFVFFSFLYFSFVYFSFAYFSFAYFSFEYFFFTCKLFFYSETFYSHTFHSYTSKQSSWIVTRHPNTYIKLKCNLAWPGGSYLEQFLKIEVRKIDVILEKHP